MKYKLSSPNSFFHVVEEFVVLKQGDTTALPVSIGGILLSIALDTALLSLAQDKSPFVV